MHAVASGHIRKMATTSFNQP